MEVGGQLRALATIPPLGKEFPVLTGQEARWAPKSVLTLARKICCTAGNLTQDVRPV
jgi:hypothetical protein